MYFVYNSIKINVRKLTPTKKKIKNEQGWNETENKTSWFSTHGVGRYESLFQLYAYMLCQK